MLNRNRVYVSKPSEPDGFGSELDYFSKLKLGFTFGYILILIPIIWG